MHGIMKCIKGIVMRDEQALRTWTLFNSTQSSGNNFLIKMDKCGDYL